MKEEIEKRIIAEIDTGAFCYCNLKGVISCKRHRAALSLVSSLVSQAYEDAAQEVADFDEWVSCQCSECRVDGRSHAVNTHESAHKLAANVRALKDDIKGAVG
jgi:hypothetical protein